MRRLLNPYYSLQAQLLWPLALLALISIGLLAFVVGNHSSQQIKHDRGTLLAETARQMADRMDERMRSHQQIIRVLSTLDQLRREAAWQSKQTLVEQIQSSYSEFAWIGMTDAKGNITVGTGGLLVGENVAARDWFIEGSKGMFVGDVHDGFLLASLLPPPNDPLGLRLVDLSAPLYDADGKLMGVICGHLSWEWASQLRTALLEPLEDFGDLDVLIFNREGNLLLGTPQLTTLEPDVELESLSLAQQALTGYITETWPDNKVYLTGFTQGEGYLDYPGLGWLMLVREPAAEAFAAATGVRNRSIVISLLSALFSLLATWLVLAKVIDPLGRISAAANRIRQGDTHTTIPSVPRQDEIGTLAESLQAMYQQIKDKRAHLEDLVAQRTQELEHLNHKLEASNQKLQLLSDSDALLGIANRRCFDAHLQVEWQRAHRQQSPLSLLLLDIDHFKAYNDHYGHLAGDACLKRMASLMDQSLKRPSDLLARFGGEEFAIVLAATELQGALAVAEQIHTNVAKAKLPHAASASGKILTVSIGVATLIPNEIDTTTLVDLADKALYKAKAKGRNRTESLSPGIHMSLVLD